jgi:hypothetical protein
MIAFGRQCIANTNWTGAVPRILFEVHRQIAKEQKADDLTTDSYWRRDGVWEDVRSSFERYFALNPNAVAWRHDYALAAYKAGAWTELNRQIKLLGRINYKFFGGQEGFDKMVAEAAAHQ